MSSLIRSIIALHNLINNKLANRQLEQEKKLKEIADKEAKEAKDKEAAEKAAKDKESAAASSSSAAAEAKKA